MQENNSKSNNMPTNKKGSLFNECKSEFKKITWTTKKNLFKQTVTVIVLSLIVGAIIYCYDIIISFFFQKLINI